MMNKLLLSLVLLPFVSLAQQNFTINGKLKPSASPAKALLYYKLNGETIIDSTDIKSGLFTFKGNISGYTSAHIKIKKPTGNVTPGRREASDIKSFWLQAGTLDIVSQSDLIASAKVTGTEVSDAIAKLEALKDAINAKAKAFVVPFYAAPLEQQQDPTFQAPFQKKGEEFKAEMESLQPNFMRDNPDNYYSLLIYRDVIFKKFDPAGTKDQFDALSARLKVTPLGKQLQQQIVAGTVLAIGEIAPDFTQNDVNGKPVKLSDYRGKYVLVDFWASWCAPCREENPWVKHMYDRYKDKNFTVLGVSLDNPGQKEAWLKAIKDDKLTWSNVSDLKGFKNEVAILYMVQALPTNFLIGPDGKIIAKNLRGIGLTQKLTEVLGEITPGK